MSAEPLHVLLISLHTCPLEQPGSGDAGGMNVYVRHLAEALVAAGHTVDMATLDRAPGAPRTAGVRTTAIRAGLRLLEEHEAKVKALQDALIAGEQSGEPRPFDFDSFKARKRAEFEAG